MNYTLIFCQQSKARNRQLVQSNYSQMYIIYVSVILLLFCMYNFSYIQLIYVIYFLLQLVYVYQSQLYLIISITSKSNSKHVKYFFFTEQQTGSLQSVKYFYLTDSNIQVAKMYKKQVIAKTHCNTVLLQYLFSVQRGAQFTFQNKLPVAGKGISDVSTPKSLFSSSVMSSTNPTKSSISPLFASPKITTLTPKIPSNTYKIRLQSNSTENHTSNKEISHNKLSKIQS